MGAIRQERVNKCTFCFAPQMASRSLTSACLRCCSACSKSSKAALIWARASALRSCNCWLMPPTKAIAADSCGSLGRETTHTGVASGVLTKPSLLPTAALQEIPYLRPPCSLCFTYPALGPSSCPVETPTLMAPPAQVPTSTYRPRTASSWRCRAALCCSTTSRSSTVPCSRCSPARHSPHMAVSQASQ